VRAHDDLRSKKMHAMTAVKVEYIEPLAEGLSVLQADQLRVPKLDFAGVTSIPAPILSREVCWALVVMKGLAFCVLDTNIR
jgi:hypothetical protein